MKKDDYKIRAAGFEDAVDISRIIRANPETLLARPIGDIVQNIDRFLVAQTAKSICGTVSWQILPEIGAPHNPSVEIKSLAVDTDFRGLGIGKALVEKAISQIRLLHPVQIIALTFAPEFFEKLGFRQVAKESLMHKIYAGCVNCTRYDSPFTCPEIAVALDIRA